MVAAIKPTSPPVFLLKLLALARAVILVRSRHGQAHAAAQQAACASLARHDVMPLLQRVCGAQRHGACAVCLPATIFVRCEDLELVGGMLRGQPAS